MTSKMAAESKGRHGTRHTLHFYSCRTNNPFALQCPSRGN